MNVFVCEDTAVSALNPLTLARPACDLTIGEGSLVEFLTHLGQVHRVLRPHLQAYLAALGGKRVPHWGGPVLPERARPSSSEQGRLMLLVNARLIPSRPSLITLRSLIEAGQPGLVTAGDALAAALVHRDATGRGGEMGLLDAVIAGAQPLDAFTAVATLPHLDATLPLLESPQDLLTAHEASLEDMLVVALDSGRYAEQQPGLFVEQTDTPALAPVVANTVAIRGGPVLVDAAAEIGPFCCFDGPVRIGRRTRVHPHSWIGAGTVAGHDCRLGGEIAATVIEPFSNKAHGGFLGHSHLGSWVNLAAGTVTGNLKFSYGSIRLRESDGASRDTGRQFFGSLIGDFTKTAIQTAISCGSLIGPAALLGGQVPNRVEAFMTQLGDPTLDGPAGIEPLATAVGRMMERRGMPFHPADQELLRAVAELAGSSDG
jgi:glucose-1-phosphate thymidylyltransferase